MSKMKRKLLSLLMTAAMISTLFAGLTISASAYTATDTMTNLWNNGNPTSAANGTYYSISSAQELIYLQNYTSNSGMNTSGVTFYLTTNINFTTETYTGTWSGLGTSAISSASTNSPYETGSAIPFSGTLDGCGYTITVNRSVSTSGQGGVVNYLGNTGAVKNLNVTGTVTATGSVDAIGGVVGYNSGVIDKVTSSVVVSAESAYNVGGIAGFNNRYYNTSGTALVSGTDTINGYILNSANKGNITGYRKVGGIVGENAGKINSCSNTATIVGKYNSKNGVGGIAGSNGNKDTAIETGNIWNCYNTANIICSSTGGVTTNNSYLGSWVGGICGFQNSLSNCVNCFNTGNLTGYNYRDNIAGKNEGMVSNCYRISSVTSAQLYDGAILVDSVNSPDFVNNKINKGAVGFWKIGNSTAELNNIAQMNSDNPASNVITFTMYSAPFQTTYAVGDTFDMTGTVIRAYNMNGTYTEVSGFSASNTSELSATDTSVTISGSYAGQNYSFNIGITVRTPSTYYLDTANGSDDNAGTSSSNAFKTLNKALTTATGAGDIIQVMNTVTISGAVTMHNNVVFKRYSGFSGTMFEINPGSGNLVRLTTMRIDGGATGTIFNVTSGTLNLRGGILLKNGVTGVNVGTNGTLEVNKAFISASTNSIVNNGNLTVSDYGGTTINGAIYLASSKYITLGAAVPSSGLTIDVPDYSTPIRIVAYGNNYHQLNANDANLIHTLNNSYVVIYNSSLSALILGGAE